MARESAVALTEPAGTSMAGVRFHGMERSPLRAEVVERRDMPGVWGVEAIDSEGDGEVYVALFDGPKARERAFEYAEAKYS